MGLQVEEANYWEYFRQKVAGNLCATVGTAVWEWSLESLGPLQGNMSATFIHYGIALVSQAC